MCAGEGHSSQLPCACLDVFVFCLSQSHTHTATPSNPPTQNLSVAVHDVTEEMFSDVQSVWLSRDVVEKCVKPFLCVFVVSRCCCVGLALLVGPVSESCFLLCVETAQVDGSGLVCRNCARDVGPRIVG